MANADLVIAEVDQSLQPSAEKKLREVVADAYTFIRSMEANKAFSTVSLEDLIGDQIKRNGETASSNAAQYDPYSYDPHKPAPAGRAPQKRANFLGGSDTSANTKLDRVLAIKNNLADTISQIKAIPTVEVADAASYTAGTSKSPAGD